MDKSTFFRSDKVTHFVEWAVDALPTLPISLDVKSTRYVPQGMKVQTTGLQNIVPQHYIWRARGMAVGNWQETIALLSGFSINLRDAVSAKDEAAVLNACWRIIEWGGGNKTKGAYPFLVGLGTGLSEYICRNGQLMSLATADTATSLTPGGQMNSMLTKVHAFYSVDGLPIYDSRVAGAAATLVEIWRRSRGYSQNPLPEELSFPSVPERKSANTEGKRRTVSRRFPGALSPGQLYYSTPAIRWASAKVRLGWIMDEILTRSSDLWPGQPQQARMRCLEASLFMIGYDVNCI